MYIFLVIVPKAEYNSKAGSNYSGRNTHLLRVL